jgi:hypothetical protein
MRFLCVTRWLLSFYIHSGGIPFASIYWPQDVEGGLAWWTVLYIGDCPRFYLLLEFRLSSSEILKYQMP